MYSEVRRLLTEAAVGEVKLVKAYFGSPQLHIPRSVKKELGGGALLDIGVYCLQFILMVFNGERPKSIQATGVLLDSGLVTTAAQAANVCCKYVPLFNTQHRLVTVSQTNIRAEQNCVAGTKLNYIYYI